jgi:hypothetical protein
VGVDLVLVRGREAAPPVAQSHLDGTPTAVDSEGGTHEIDVAVVVEVPGRRGRGHPRRAEGGGRSEGAVAIAEQDAHAVAREIVDDGLGDNCQVELAVVVEVGDRQGHRASAGGGLHGRAEPAESVAQKHADGAVLVGRGQIEIAVIVEVAGSQVLWVRADGEIACPGEAGREAVFQGFDVQTDAAGHGKFSSHGSVCGNM